ncbi:MAG: hydroxymethylbilane synthase [Acetobacteraceae bacterium]
MSVTLNAPAAAPAPVPARTSARVGPHGPGLPLRVGSRASPLALVQTRAFLGLLTKFCPVLRGMDVFQELAIRTTGDASQASGVRLADVGGKGLFAKEIHEALLDRRIDLAVHSLKDLETELPAGVVLACTLRREDPRDALIIGPDAGEAHASADPYAGLPRGALIGSSSVRRQAQLLHARPDLRVETIRGNVHSRLDKVRRGEFGASLLALAGLRRLGLEHEADVAVDADIMVPAACQGIVGITVRRSDCELHRLLAAITDPEAECAAAAERALLGTLDGSCHTPIGAYARLLPEGRMRLTGLVARADGSFLLKRSLECRRDDAARAGAELGNNLRRDSPRDVFG